MDLEGGLSLGLKIISLNRRLTVEEPRARDPGWFGKFVCGGQPSDARRCPELRWSWEAATQDQKTVQQLSWGQRKNNHWLSVYRIVVVPISGRMDGCH